MSNSDSGDVEVPDSIPILPLRNSVLFPGSIIPIDVGRRKSVRLIEDAISKERPVIGILTQKDARTEEPTMDDMYSIGCAARILKVIKLAKDNFSVILQGVARIEVESLDGTEPFMAATVKTVPDGETSDVELDALVMNLKDIAKRVVKLMPELPKEAGALVDSVTEPGHLADLITSNLELEVAEKQEILETFELKARMRLVLTFLSRQLEVLKVRERINTQVQEEMGRNQREYVLRQQLKAIRDELGELEEGGSDLDEFREKIEEADMPEEAAIAAKKQLDRLKQMQASSAEYTVTRTYLEWLCELPWNTSTDDHIELDKVRSVLDQDHYGLDKVKKRIVEYMAVRKLKSDKKGPILCLAGPPGVGKTSLGRSVARAIGRKFVRISLGGVRDEAEVRGHRRTYVGSMPGRIIQGIKKAGTNNPVFVLDEIDKLGHDFRGDPGSALLEVLDPEQNSTFSDHYLEVPFDLSKVMFIATANVLDSIPWALRDRLEIIDLAGYTRHDKKQIARRYLVPKQLEEHGLADGVCEITDDAVSIVIDSHTREAGVRNLGRELGSLARGVAVKIAEGIQDKEVIDKPEDVAKYLGAPKYESEVAERTSEPGVATGLAWTAVGGEILFIEATTMPGKGKLTLTGQLGDVMKESVMAALSFIRSRAPRLGLDVGNFVEKVDLHVHVPAGAVPKDGPSAGVTMYTALVSLFLGIPVRADVAMTGEISLRGNVMPVGGVKEKLLAAHRAGIKRVILPERNLKDLVDVPQEIKDEMEIFGAKRMDEVLHHALTKVPEGLEPLPEDSAKDGTAAAPAKKKKASKSQPKT